MATRVEAVLADIEAEMVTRGVDVTHYWGKRLAEARKTVNWVAWTEDDDAERGGGALGDRTSRADRAAKPTLATSPLRQTRK